MMRQLFFFLTLAFFCTVEAEASGMLITSNQRFSDSLQVKVFSNGNIIKTSLNGGYKGAALFTGTADDLHFYVFDLSGTLMHRATIIEKEKCRLPLLQKGVYLYDVFKNDLSIEEGRIVIE